MKETIYSIPINQAFEITDGACPICRLYGRLVEDTLEYTLGAAMMEPDMRKLTNAQGFCPGHLSMLLERQKRLPLALVLQTHLDELRGDTKLLLAPPSCYVCARTGGFLQAYYSNILHLWKTEPDFVRKWEVQKAVCRPHIAGLAAAAPRDLSKKEAAVFMGGLAEKARAQLSALSESLGVFIKSFDHRFSGEPLGEHKEAVQNAAAYLSGGKRNG